MSTISADVHLLNEVHKVQINEINFRENASNALTVMLDLIWLCDYVRFNFIKINSIKRT